MCLRFLTGLLLFWANPYGASAQHLVTNYNFRRVGTKDGMSDMVVRCITQDKYGYLWFGTQAGLNRYDGYRVTRYIFNRKDSLSIPPDFVQALYCDRSGNLWIGYKSGLYRYDYKTTGFRRVRELENTSINDIREAKQALMLFTNKGLVSFQPSGNKVEWLSAGLQNGLRSLAVWNGCVRGDSVLAASDSGVILYSGSKGTARLLTPEKQGSSGVDRVITDASGTIWVSKYDKGALLYRLRKGAASFEKITVLRYNYLGSTENIQDMYADSQNRVWVATIWNGLVLFSNEGTTYKAIVHNQRFTSSIPENHITKIYEDRQGFIWVGTEGAGAASFQPDYNLFSTFIPTHYKNARPHIWCRTLAEDQLGNLWMGTGLGLVVQYADPARYKVFESHATTNDTVLHSGSIRSLLCDQENNIWIGTSSGVNFFNSKTQRLSAFAEKDSLPLGFYWALLQDHRHTIWLGSTYGLSFKLAGETGFHTLAAIPALRQYAGYGTRSLFQDSRGYLWIGLNGKGLIRYHPLTQETRFWNGIDPDTSRLGKVITSITEDRKGMIWFSSYYGIAAFNYQTGQMTNYADPAILGSLQTSSLQVDANDRIWLASTRGLLMLDRERRIFKRFGPEDGLPDIQFSDQIAYTLKNGNFVYPTYDGFVSFNPLAYKERNISGNVIVSAITLEGKSYVSSTDIREASRITLSGTQNFFTIEVTAFNYSNPAETWYAYKLDGFDKDWVYSRTRVVNYTNVPGGRYRFRYKASSDPNNWNQPEKMLEIRVGSLFYKTVWFWILMIGVVALLLGWLYRNRLRHQQKLHLLQGKAQSLEKEKALVMYENLKQQLNPHYLFNSLTSLNSLIQLDPPKASQFLESLSKTYRYILKNRDSELVSLGDELKFTQIFISLQQTRFEEGLQVYIEVPEEDEHRQIVPVTLQNLVENAIKHNIIDSEMPLRIRITVVADYLVVCNNLQRKNFVDTSNKQGLQNLLTLYHYLTNLPVLIEEDAPFFTIKIPLL